MRTLVGCNYVVLPDDNSTLNSQDLIDIIKEDKGVFKPNVSSSAQDEWH